MTIPGLSGSLLSHEALLALHPQPADTTGAERRAFRRWHVSVRDRLGPAHGSRAVFDVVAAPLAQHLGFRVLPAHALPEAQHATLEAGGHPVAVLITLPWGHDPAAAWRDGVRRGIANDVRWCYCVNGPALRVIDASRAHSRRFAEFDLAATADDEPAFAIFHRLVSARWMAGGDDRSALSQALVASERHRVSVRASLQRGVHDALAHLVRAFRDTSRGRRADAHAGDESLIVIYRILFLLFAEARGLVPRWHPVYRDSYTIESLRDRVESVVPPRGLWESLQAISRLAHAGCRAGALRVTPFNGRLFSPAHAPLADARALDDRAVRRALLAVTTRPGKDRRERISYADLGVEQLGGVYEHLLDYEYGTAVEGAVLRAPASAGRRKATGSFYTPRSLTEYVVRRALAPLVERAAPEEVLAIRVVDPAMGSGAFLVAACRYLADQYERALVREGRLSATDVQPEDRAGFRRTIAQRCLFGVDVNPMAVQLGRLSLWLATLAADRPLTFLDHNLRSGNSLVGSSLQDMLRQPSPGGAASRLATLPLFPLDSFQDAVASTVGPRLSIAVEPGDTLEQVRHKERLLSTIADPSSPAQRWKAAADLWCAAWYQPRERRAKRGEFASLLDAMLGQPTALPRHVAEPRLAEARGVARRERFFHWSLEFPEIFSDAAGVPLTDGGFHAVVGNPPWEMLREAADASASSRGEAIRADAMVAGDRGALVAFARGSGIYPLHTSGHTNLYQLFVERALGLLRRGGRLGMVLPSGFASDHGCGALRRHVLDRTTVDTFVVVDNREAIFPIHRSIRFLLITASNGGSTRALPIRAGVRSADVLDRLPDSGPDEEAVTVSRVLVERASGAQLAVPDIRTHADLAVFSHAAFSVPALGDRDGWHVHFGRELNATDDKPHFHGGARGLPVVEGKLMRPFALDTGSARLRIDADVAARLLGARGPQTQARLGYREVAAATNRLTLIAAIVPAGVVTTHTIFCLREPLDDTAQHFLCAMFNSYVANFLVRTRVGTHVTSAIIDRLPVPRPGREDDGFREAVRLARRLARGPDAAAAAQLQAVAARLYGLSADGFAHVLDTFPLVPDTERAAALDSFRCIVA
jgi:hypothetical protein